MLMGEPEENGGQGEGKESGVDVGDEVRFGVGVVGKYILGMSVMKPG